MEDLDRQCQELSATIDGLNMQLAEKAKECASVQHRLKEFGEVYEKENRELEEDFVKIKAENEKLMTRAETVDGTNVKLTDDNLQLEAELKQLRQVQYFEIGDLVSVRTQTGGEWAATTLYSTYTVPRSISKF